MTILSSEQFIHVFGRHPASVYMEDPRFFIREDVVFSPEFMDHVMVLAEAFCKTFREDC